MRLPRVPESLLFLSGALVFHAPCAAAQGDSAAARVSAADTGRVFRLGAVQVRAPGSVAERAFAETVSAATLRLHNRNDLARALSLVPGVTVSNVGPRNEAGVNVRGFDLRQVPLFVDGIPVYVPYDGYVDLRRFTTFDAAQVSVSKGFSSVLLGPNALGGAINVVTRRPSAPLEASGATSVSSGQGLDSYLNLGMRRSRWYAQASGSIARQQTYPLSERFDPVSLQPAGERANALRDDRRLSGKVGLTTGRGDEYAIGYSDQRGEKGNPTYAGTAPQTIRYWRWPRWDKRSVFALSHTRLGEAGQLSGRVYYDQFDNTLEAYDDATYSTKSRPSSFTSIYHDDTYGGSLEFAPVAYAGHQLSAAAHLKLDRHEEFNVGEPLRHFRDRTASLAVQDVYRLSDRLSMIGGVSYEGRNALRAEGLENGAVVALAPGRGTSWNPQLAGIYDLRTFGALRASVARRTRFPTIKDRYSYRLGQAIPNPDLTSERATHFELRYNSAAVANWELQASIFYSRIDDAIQRVDSVSRASGGARVFQLQNVGQVESRGFELAASRMLARWARASASYAHLARRNVTSPAIRLTDTPTSTAAGNVVLTPSGWLAVVGNLEWNSWRYSSTAGQRVAGFVAVDGKAVLSLRRDLSVEAGVRNAFDRNYELVAGFPEPGRIVSIGLRYSVVRRTS